MTSALCDEWVEKAEADYLAARDLSRRRTQPLPDTVCFHCQQCAEKYLKAFLIDHGTVPPRSHDLENLLKVALPYAASLVLLLPDLDILNSYSVELRYPGVAASVLEAKAALSAIVRIRTALRAALGLPRLPAL